MSDSASALLLVHFLSHSAVQAGSSCSRCSAFSEGWALAARCEQGNCRMAEARGSIFSMSWRGALRHKMGSEASDDMSAEFHELNNGGWWAWWGGGGEGEACSSRRADALHRAEAHAEIYGGS